MKGRPDSSSRPRDGKPLIVTAGHVYLGPMTLSARFEGMRKPVPCELVDVNEDLDLMVVSPVEPIDAPALRLPLPGSLAAVLGDQVWLVGCPGGLEASFQDGFINSEPTTAAAIHKARLGVNAKSGAGPQGDTSIIRHNAFSTEGMSGCPLVNRKGVVIGVQVAALPDAKKESFAVDVRHLAALNLNKPPVAFKNGPHRNSLAATDLQPSQTVALQAFAPAPIKINGSIIDAECIHRGYVSRDADTVIRGFIEDPDAFRESFTKERLQHILDETPLAQITNPVFGFRFLVPKDYRYDASQQSNPEGMIVTLTNPDSTIPALTTRLRYEHSLQPTTTFLRRRRSTRE